jgi:hypothetical protein
MKPSYEKPNFYFFRLNLFDECVCYLDAAIFNMNKKIEGID